MSKQWAFAILALGLALAAVGAIARAHSPISCERAGSFGVGFSRDFDVVRTECRIEGIKHSPLITFYQAPPYVELSWRE
jgi:hypothetical protein